jgi:hypothetical protein
VRQIRSPASYRLHKAADALVLDDDGSRTVATISTKAITKSQPINVKATPSEPK